MRGDQVVGPGEGTVYIVTGGGGADLDPLGPLGTFTAVAESSLHFVRVTVDGGTLRADMIHAEDGTIGDSVTLVKPVGSTTTSTTTTVPASTTTTTLAPCAASESCRDDDPCTEDACDIPTRSCVHTAVPGCCGTDADCDDGDPCTRENCAASRTCERERVQFQPSGLLDPGLGIAACRTQRVPRAIARLLGQASRLGQQASRTHRPTRARTLLRLAMRRIDASRRQASRAEHGGRISADCATALDTLIDRSWSLPGQCLIAALR
jgi:hypothetical protein